MAACVRPGRERGPTRSWASTTCCCPRASACRFARRRDLAERDGQLNPASQSAAAQLAWEIPGESLARVNAHFEMLAKSTLPEQWTSDGAAVSTRSGQRAPERCREFSAFRKTVCRMDGRSRKRQVFHVKHLFVKKAREVRPRRVRRLAAGGGRARALGAGARMRADRRAGPGGAGAGSAGARMRSSWCARGCAIAPRSASPRHGAAARHSRPATGRARPSAARSALLPLSITSIIRFQREASEGLIASRARARRGGKAHYDRSNRVLQPELRALRRSRRRTQTAQPVAWPTRSSRSHRRRCR